MLDPPSSFEMTGKAGTEVGQGSQRLPPNQSSHHPSLPIPHSLLSTLRLTVLLTHLANHCRLAFDIRDGKYSKDMVKEGEGEERGGVYHGAEGDGGQGVVEDGHGVECKADGEAGEGEERGGEQHRLHPVLAWTQNPHDNKRHVRCSHSLSF